MEDYMNETASDSFAATRVAGERRSHNWWIHLLMMICALCCILPFILILVVSFTDEKAVMLNGYTLFPSKWSVNAYKFLFINPMTIIRAYGITIFVVVVGTSISLFLGTMISYVISRTDYPFRKGISFYVFFTMLFNGGLVPTYILYSNIFHFRDTLAALIVPGLLLNGWNILIMRTFFNSNVTSSLIESAYLDGAGDFKIYLEIVMPLSIPVLAAIGFMTMLMYWNDWFNSMIYINNVKLYSLSYLMTKTLLDIQTLQSATELTSEMRKVLGQMPSETIRMAMAVVGAGPMLFAFPFFQKYFISGLTIGAVKG